MRLLQKHRKRFVSALSFFLLYYKWFLYAVFDLLINSPFLIIVNAIRYSSGSIKIDLKQGKEKSAIFIIENPIDSKVEIDPNRLFERFYTGDKSRHNSGTGVGLAVVKLLTDKLGGNVFAKIENDTLTISLEIK